MTTFTQKQVEDIHRAVVSAIEEVVRTFDADAPEIKAAAEELAKYGFKPEDFDPMDDLVIAIRREASRAMFQAIDAMGLSGPAYVD